MELEQQILFKQKYMSEVKSNPKTILLSPYEAEHKDHWANRIFGNPKYAFMFQVLISNIRYAINNGYEVAEIWQK